MNRRNFLKFLSTAVVGTGVAYSFPSIIVPKNIIIPESPIVGIAMNGELVGKPITFKMLEEVYNRCMIGNREPDFLLLNQSQLAYITEMFPLQERSIKVLQNGEYGLQYRNAALLSRRKDFDSISGGRFWN